MIRVHRPKDAPAQLTSDQTEALRLGLQARYDADPTGFNSGSRAFSGDDFDRRVYGHASVKDALILAQHGKCAWCERKPEGGGGSFGDVEHYRPKGRVRQRAGEPGLSPGYYWRAYSWQNLLFSCQHCNQRHKRDLFPLANPSNRARSHHDRLDSERPLLIDPACEDDDPRHHIEFREDLPHGLTDAGRCTIQTLALDRDPGEARATRYRELSRITEAFRIIRAQPENASPAALLRGVLLSAKAEDAPFSSMARDLIASLLDDEK